MTEEPDASKRFAIQIVPKRSDAFLSELRGGEHGCLFYINESDRKRLQYLFLKTGLEQRWFCVYATATEEPQEVRQSMKNYQLDPDEHSQDLLIIRGEELFDDPRNPNLEKWLTSVSNIYNQAIGIGKRGVRISADLSSYFLKLGLVEQWFRLESSLAKRFDKELCVLCAYDMREFMPSKGSNSSDVLEYYAKLSRTYQKFLGIHSFAIIPTSTEIANLVIALE